MMCGNQYQTLSEVLSAAEQVVVDHIPDIPEPFPLSGLEPTPIGPRGVEYVVREVPLSFSGRISPWESADASDLHTFEIETVKEETISSKRNRPVCDDSIDLSIPSRVDSSNCNEPAQKKPRGKCLPLPTSSGSPTLRSKTNTRPKRVSSRNAKKKTKSKAQAKKKDRVEEESAKARRFRIYQAEQWQARFDELISYKEVHGDCLVPHNYAENRPLAQWTKRQR